MSANGKAQEGHPTANDSCRDTIQEVCTKYCVSVLILSCLGQFPFFVSGEVVYLDVLLMYIPKMFCQATTIAVRCLLSVFSCLGKGFECALHVYR